MSKIFDNSTEDKKFKRVLKDVIAEDGVKRIDMCVGYFNLRGWNFVADEVDNLEGAYVDEEDGRKLRTARLLIGMYQAPEEIIRRQYGKPFFPDADYVQKCKRKIAEDFRRQLLIGKTTKQDEDTLRVLARQLEENKLAVKLYLKEPLHAKLYLAYNPNSSICAIEGIISPDGRVLGKMGHTERISSDTCVNVDGNKEQLLFKGGVDYFKL